ncbi:MAG TPA: hypothetical protein VGO62_08465, partial [Myxococcota bacterium]
MRFTTALVSSLLLWASAFASERARGDEGRFQDFAVGSRAAALGGAFGALSDDASGVFYNPAGLVDVRMPRLNVSTSLYGLELVGSSPIQSDLLRRGVSPSDLIFVPSSTGYVQGIGDTLPSGAYEDAFAFGTEVPDYTSRFTEDVPKTNNGTRFRSDLEDRRLLAGAAWAHRLGPWLRTGFSLQYSLRTVDAEESLVSGALDEPGAFIDASTRLRESNHSLRAVGGAKLWLGPRTTLGLTLTSPAASVWRDVSFERVVASSSGYAADRVRSTGFEWQSDLPAEARLGFAFSEPASYTIAVDVTAYGGTSYDVIEPQFLGNVDVARIPIPLHVVRGPIANAAIGIESLINDDTSVAVGVFTNFTGAPSLQLDKGGALSAASSRLSSVNMIGGSLSMGFHGEFSVTRVGFTGSTGYGDIVETAPPDARFLKDGPPLLAVKATQTFIYLFIATTFRFGEES